MRKLFFLILLYPFLVHAQNDNHQRGMVLHGDTLFVKDYTANDSIKLNRSGAIMPSDTSNQMSNYVRNSKLTDSLNAARTLIATKQPAGTYATGSGTASGTNTGDNATNSLYSGLVTNQNHSGDASGSTILTLATVNSNVGSFGSATQVPNYTVNGKGLITAAANTTIQIPESQVTNLTTDLAAKQATLVSNTNIKTVNGTSLLGSGDITQTTVTGNAGTATTLQNARNINGVSFNGSANINVTGSGEDASITSASGAINTTETIIAKTPALAANRLVAGTTIRITLIGTCTSTVANASTFAVRIGTAGTTSDGLMQSAVTSPAAATSGTTIPFKAVFEITIRTIGSSATSWGALTLINHGVTGIASQTNEIIVPSFTNFNSTTASNIISVTYKSAATTTTCTFQYALIELVYQ